MRTTAEETMLNDERIIAAAIEVFALKGYKATSMQDIADKARISRGPLYYRYKTKKELFIAALDAYAQQELDNQIHIFRQQKPFMDKLRDYLYTSIKYIRDDIPVFPMDISPDPDMQDVNDRIRKAYAWAYMQIKNAIVLAVHTGELKPDTDVECIVNLIFITFDGLRYSRLKTGVVPSISKAEESIDCICRLLETGYSTA